MTEDALIGLQVNAPEIVGTRKALVKVEQVSQALNAIREHRPIDVFGRSDDPALDTGGGDDFSFF